MSRRLLPLLLLSLPLLGLTLPDPLEEALRSIRQHEIRAHLALLASDALEGRAPGTRGGELAALYVASQLAEAGVEPIGAGYLQPVPLIALAPQPTRTVATFMRGGRAITLDHGGQFFAWPENADSMARVDAELVFAGYGVDAPAYDWNDFGERDLRGKVLMVLVNDPPAPPEEPLLFEGRAMTYYGRWTYKIEEARRRGAVGVLIVHETTAAGYPWSVVQSSWSSERLALPTRTAQADSLAVAGWLTFAAADSVLQLADRGLAELAASAARRSFDAVPTGIRVRISAPAALRTVDAANVWGILPGSDATLRDEIVVYTAHYDHIGVAAPVDGDSIYNGAYDNASGVAALLEIADAFARMEPAPRRSILFLVTTAEETGLLGAEHYVRHPAVPLARTAAVINLDGVNVWGETEDVIALGGERSTLGAAVRARADSMGLRVTGDRAPEKGVFYRSDHFPFVRAGVPAVKIEHGSDFRNRPDGWGERVLQAYSLEHYHRPSDEYDPDMNLAGAVQQARLAAAVGYDVAQADELPAWRPGGGFTRAVPGPLDR